MPDVDRLLGENLALALGLLALLVVALLALSVAQTIRLNRALRAYRLLVRDGEGGSLREVLDRHLAAVGRASERMDAMEALHGLLVDRTQRSLQHIGMVRFNPFDDTGSDQSFAIALLDDRRDGVVISSLHGRTTTRVFAKPVAEGGSPHHLSDEEAHAIRIAVGGTRAR